MTVSKNDVLHLINDLSETELRIVYTFIEEFKIAEAERANIVNHSDFHSSARID